jgi:hypothetical protein
MKVGVLILLFIATACPNPSSFIVPQDKGCEAAVQHVAKPPDLAAYQPQTGLRRFILRRSMRAPRLPLMIIFLSLLVSAPATGETLGDARVGFSAERVLVIDGQSYAGRMWHMPGEQRHEQELPAIKPVFILRAGNTRADIVLPQLHTVVEVALPEELSILSNPNLLRRPVGQETVNGITTTKYAVDENLPGGHIAGALWLSRDGIPMRCDGKFESKRGKTSTVHWELRNVKFGRQDEALFAVPQGYAKLSPEAAAPLLGMHLAKPSAH